MISKAKLKELTGYKLAKHCDEDEVFVVEGPKMVEELLCSAFQTEVICAKNEWFESHRDTVVSVPQVWEVSDEELERISGLKTPNMVWALAKRQITSEVKPQGLILALDHLQDPGNLGTIIRTADWFGIRQVVCSLDSVSCYNPKVVQSSMGGIFRTHICYTALASWLQECPLPVYGALLDGDNLFQQKLPDEAVIVIGNESKGISVEIQKLVGHRVAIPNIGGTCESLNAASATAILCASFAAAKK